ncbi:MAG: prepilin-type N-terminal cleavage/methylation domain-containing protein [Nitrospirota bacterium]|nr:MAG: prepilin-type N-terminal cleavage/methylation domain-containing protein [Nitrospirota bacterium]
MRDQKGFTLIELLIVICIIGILSGIAVTSYVGVTRKAARTEGYGNLESLRLLQEQYYSENGFYASITASATDNIDYKATPQDSSDNGIEDVLPGFRPSGESQFTFRILENRRMPDTPTVPFDPTSVIAQDFTATPPDPPCFVAIATAIAGTRVDGDVFAIDCFNNRNF